MKNIKIFLVLALSAIVLQVNATLTVLSSNKKYQDKNGDTALHRIARDCKQEKHVVPVGINPWIRNKNGKSAYDIAKEQSEKSECEEMALAIEKYQQEYLNNLWVAGNDGDVDWDQPAIVEYKKTRQVFIKTSPSENWYETRKIKKENKGL